MHRPPNPRLVLALATLCMLGLSSCAAILNGGRKLNLTTVPPNAHVLVDGSLRGATPMKLKLRRNQRPTIELHKPGYQPQQVVANWHFETGWLWADLFLTGGVGLVVDLLSEACYSLEPQNMHLPLTPLPPSQGPVLQSGPVDEAGNLMEAHTTDGPAPAPAGFTLPALPATEYDDEGLTEADMLRLRELKHLLDQGILTQEEFDLQKARILNPPRRRR